MENAPQLAANPLRAVVAETKIKKVKKTPESTKSTKSGTTLGLYRNDDSKFRFAGCLRAVAAGVIWLLTAGMFAWMDPAGGGGAHGRRIRGKGISWVDVSDDEGEESEEDDEEEAGPRPTQSMWRKAFMRKRKVELVKSAEGLFSYRCPVPGCPYVMRHKQDKVVGTWALQVKNLPPPPNTHPILPALDRT